MRKNAIGVVCIGIAIIVVVTGLYVTGNLSGNLLTTPSPPPQFQGSLVMNWNEYFDPEEYLPAGDDFVAISSSTGHQLALRSNGTIVCLGSNMYGQCDVPDESDFIAVSAGSEHSLALRSNGMIACWGSDRSNECDVPNENNFVAIAAGDRNSLALRSDGTIAAWGYDNYGQIKVPSGDDFIAIAAEDYHHLALRSDGTIACWGYEGSCDVPRGDDYVAVSVSRSGNLALRSNGELVAWDACNLWNYNTPKGNDYVAISAGNKNNLALRSNGTIVCWGYETFRCNFTSSTNAIAISEGHPNLAITNPRAREILAAEWQKTKGKISQKTGANRIQPQPSPTSFYPAEYVNNASVPEVPEIITIYTPVKPDYTLNDITLLSRGLKIPGSGKIVETESWFVNDDPEDDPGAPLFMVSKVIKKISYTDRLRYGDFLTRDVPQPQKLIPDEQAATKVVEILTAANLMPADAVLDQTRHNAVEKLNASGKREIANVEIVVYLHREMDGLRVENSRIKAEVNADGDIIDLFMSWRDYTPYKTVAVKPVDVAFKEFAQKKLHHHLSGEPEKVIVNDLSLRYYSQVPAATENYLQPVYIFEGYVQRGDKTEPFGNVYIPATIEQFDYVPEYC